MPGTPERQALRDAGLHATILERCPDEVRSALDATRAALGSATTVDLVKLHGALTANLQLQPRIAAFVEAASAEGGTPFGSDELFDAITYWIVDMQLGNGLLWRAEIQPVRP